MSNEHKNQSPSSSAFSSGEDSLITHKAKRPPMNILAIQRAAAAVPNSGAKEDMKINQILLPEEFIDRIKKEDEANPVDPGTLAVSLTLHEALYRANARKASESSSSEKPKPPGKPSI
jgi:hypothetical protein